MNTNPNLETDIPAYFQEMVTEKQRAGMYAPIAKKAATDQIHADAKAGLLDREKSIQWLISRRMEEGDTSAAAERYIRADIPTQAS